MAWFARIVVSTFLCAVALSKAAAADDAAVAMQAGLRAAEQRDFVRAAAQFQIVRRQDPESSLALYNLGLAEAEIPGREPRAICWLAAFLAARPNVENRDAIVAKIGELEALSHRNIETLIALTQEAGNRVPDGRGEWRDLVVFRTAALWVTADDHEKAKELLPALPAHSRYSDRLRSALAGDTYFDLAHVGIKANDKNAGYNLDYYEPNTPWSRFYRWVSTALGQAEEEDEKRAAAWLNACDGYALSQPLFTGQADHLRALAANYQSRGEWSAPVGLARDITDETAEVIYVHNAKRWEVSQLIATISTPWLALTLLSLMAVTYFACIVIGPFTPLGPTAATTPAKQKLTLAAGMFVTWLALAALTTHSVISAGAEFANTAIPYAIIGGAFLVFVAVGSAVCLWACVLSIKALFVRANAK